MLKFEWDARKAALNLRKHGFEVFADGRVHLSHRIGRGQSISLLGKEISVTNHSSRRRYYLTRNRLVMFGRYGANERTWLLSGLFWLAVLVPSIAVGVRRLHDTGRSGWWLLIGFIPLIGAIVLIVFFLFDSQPGTNAYGPNPKEAPASA